MHSAFVALAQSDATGAENHAVISFAYLCLRHILCSGAFILSACFGMFDFLACLTTFFFRLVSFPFTFAARFVL
jgi:hypothetical protein